MSVDSPPQFGRFSLTPQSGTRIETKYRRIITDLPVPESLPYFERLQRHEPVAMQCQPPLLWDHAEGAIVHDPFGNRWIDWSSCVLVANAGHAHPKIHERVASLVDRRQLATYVFAHTDRVELVERLAAVAPDGLDKVFLLTTGSEAVENTVKLMRAWGRNQHPDKRTIVSFYGGFHGRTLGSQRAGGIPGLKTWIGDDDPTFIQVPFPDGYLQQDVSFEIFERTLDEAGINPAMVAGVVSETFLGIGPDFFPVDYAQDLRRWCDVNSALLTFDEVQAGFGRTGKFFAFEHYGVVPDLIACGKGISGSLPLAAVIGRGSVMDTFPVGSMTSTHSGSPLSVAAGLGAIDALVSEGLVERAARLESTIAAVLERLQRRHPKRIGCTRVKGLVGGVRVVQPGSLEPDPDFTHATVESCFRNGLLLFAPVGLGGGCLKIAPPLSIPEDALVESLNVFEEAFDGVAADA